MTNHLITKRAFIKRNSERIEQKVDPYKEQLDLAGGLSEQYTLTNWYLNERELSGVLWITSDGNCHGRLHGRHYNSFS